MDFSWDLNVSPGEPGVPGTPQTPIFAFGSIGVQILPQPLFGGFAGQILLQPVDVIVALDHVLLAGELAE